MKELDDFTVERLERIAERRSGIMPTMREIAALARIALAAKTAQPLCVEIQMNAADLLRRLEEMTKWRSPAEPILMPVFESNSPELPDGWIPCALRMPEVGELVLIYTRHIEMIVASLDADGFFATSEGTCYHPDSVVLWQPAP
ncbi:TPA: hypothetical protein ACSTL5_004900, partial [Serratia fonticola]